MAWVGGSCVVGRASCVVGRASWVVGTVLGLTIEGPD